MKLSKPSPNLARNDFDLSNRYVHTANFGELRPSLCVETVPGDYIEIDAANLVRAIPFVASPFLRVKQHIDVWFVPYQDLWHNFNQFITRRSDPLSSSLKSPNFCPHFYVSDVLNIGQSGDTDVVGRDWRIGRDTLLEDLGYISKKNAVVQQPPASNAWRILAYNKIWYCEYRNNYYDDGTHLLDQSLNPSYLFNVDDTACNSYAAANIDDGTGTRLQAMFQMRYRQWKKDLFTGLLPSTQFGAVSSVSGYMTGETGFEVGRWLSVQTGQSATNSTTPVTMYSGGAGTVLNQAGVQSLEHTHLVTGTSSIDVLALKRSEAIQKWRQIALLSGNSSRDNMIGHYGEAPSAERDHRPVYVGSWSAPLNIGDINATAETGQSTNGVLGDVAGKGISTVNGKTLKFKASDFGVLMAITSFLPEAEYNATGMDRLNQLLEPEDYFNPEYQNLGLEAVSTQTFYTDDLSNAAVIGYAPRYYGYKTKIDRCSAPFFSDTAGQQNGIFSQWCSPRQDVQNWLDSFGGIYKPMPLSLLYVNPALFDNNFKVGLANSDQFLVDQYYEIKAVRPMSELGLPQF